MPNDFFLRNVMAYRVTYPPQLRKFGVNSAAELGLTPFKLEC